MESFEVLIKPVITEKVHIMKEADNKIAFKVHKYANKTDVRLAVEKIMSVKVSKVNILNQLGKKKRMGKFTGKRPDFKKAIVTLVKGEKAPLFET